MNKKEQKVKKDNGSVVDDVVIGCISPVKCLIGTAIDPKNPPADAQKMYCTNSKCTENMHLHRECFENLETFLVESMLKSKRTRGRDWTTDQWLHNLWLKKGYEIVFPHCPCPCGGHLRKDDGQPAVLAAAAAAAPVKPKKTKQKNLPALVTNAPYHKNPVGKTFPTIKVNNNNASNIQSQRPNSKAKTNQSQWCHNYSDYEASVASNNEWSPKSENQGFLSSSTPTESKTFIVMSSVGTLAELKRSLIQLIKTNGRPLVSTDVRILSLLDQARAELITELCHGYGDFLDWAKCMPDFYVNDSGLIDLAQNAPVIVHVEEQVQNPAKYAPAVYKPSVNGDNKDGWRLATGRKSGNRPSFSVVDLDEVSVAGSTCDDASLDDCSVGERKTESRSTSDDRSYRTVATTDTDVEDEYYPAPSSPVPVVSTYNYGLNTQKMYGKFLTSSHSLDVAYEYGYVAKEIEKLCFTMN